MFSRAWYRLYVFPRLSPVQWHVILYWASAFGYMFSRAYHQFWHVFPRLTPAVYFLALGTSTDHVFRAWNRLYVFKRLVHRLHVFQRLEQFLCFFAFCTDCMFFVSVFGTGCLLFLLRALTGSRLMLLAFVLIAFVTC